MAKQEHDELDKQRRAANKKKNVAEKKSLRETTTRAAHLVSADERERSAIQKRDVQDPLVDRDPWSTYSTQRRTSYDPHQDARINALSARMEAIEGATSAVTTRVDRMEGKIDNLQGGIETRFAEVLSAIQGLASAQVADGSKRPREAPPS